MLTPDDLAPFATIEPAKAEAMIADAMAMATLVAPCLDPESGVTFTKAQSDTVRAVLRRAILRWHEVGSGVVTQQTAGPFSQSVDTTRSGSKSLFWPSEVNDLQAVCRAAGAGEVTDTKVFTVSAGRSPGSPHSPICDLFFGGAYCSCGASINAYRGPLPEYGEVMP